MSRPPHHAVVFDLDGTLVDSAPDIAEALNTAFRPLGYDRFTTADAKAMVGGGSILTVLRAGDKVGITLDDREREALMGRFMARYAEVSAEGRGLYPGCIEMLNTLQARGLKLALCTNKPAPVTAIAAKALKIDRYFSHIIGATDSVPKKPDPAMLLACCTALGADPASTVMIGDSAADNGAARNAGTGIVLVDFGYAKGPVAELKPDAVISHLAELPETLAKWRRA